MNNRRLTIRISHHSLSFSTTEDNKVVFEPYPLKTSISLAANLREALRSTPILKASYEKVAVLTDSPVLMVPADLFHEDEKNEFYHHAFIQQEGKMVLHHVLPALNAVAVFGIQKDLRQVITDHYDKVHIEPVCVPVWQYMHQKSFTGAAQKLYAYFHDQHAEVFCFTQNRFKFCNTFAVNHTNDALFYLLSAWRLLGLDPRMDELHLSGDLPDREQLTEGARRYIKRVYTNNPTGEFNRAPVTQIEGIPFDLMLYYLKGL